MGLSLSNQELYDMVWSKPLRVLAKEIGVSDVAVDKVCRRAGVPRSHHRTHSIIARFFEKDEERKKEYLRYSSSWNKPKFDSSIEKRRLRILNAIFIHYQNIGCKPNMSTSKYDHENRRASITVSETYVMLV